MKDRLKFRFWHEEEKEMFYQDNQYLSSFLRRIYAKYNVTHPSYLPFQIEERLTQCTGLKDKNDKLVYRGDYCKDKFGRIMEVRYNEVFLKFQFILLDYNKDLEWTKNFSQADIHQWKGAVEIIGNIYENYEFHEKILTELKKKITDEK